MAGGVNSPARAFGAVGGTPLFIDHAEGPYLYDTEISATATADQVNDRGTADPDVVTLPAGDHQITFETREDGAQLDTIALLSAGP